MRCSSKLSLKIKMSSRYIRQISQFSFRKIDVINRWKVNGAPTKPNGILLNSKCPFLVENAVTCLSFSLIWHWYYALETSMILKIFEFDKWLNNDSVLGILYVGLIVTELSLRQSMHILKSPPFFFATTIGADHGLIDSLIMPLSFRFSTC